MLLSVLVPDWVAVPTTNCTWIHWRLSLTSVTSSLRNMMLTIHYLTSTVLLTLYCASDLSCRIRAATTRPHLQLPAHVSVCHYFQLKVSHTATSYQHVSTPTHAALPTIFSPSLHYFSALTAPIWQLRDNPLTLILALKGHATNWIHPLYQPGGVIQLSATLFFIVSLL